MTDPQSGLPADSLAADGTRSVQTSTTNIGAYMWSTLVARELGIVDRREAVARLSRTIASLEGMERHPESGQFFNWYDHRTGEKLTTWPPSGDPLTPILSSVDNGWLAVGLRLVGRMVPELSRRAGALYDSMDFGFYYRPDVNRILFHYGRWGFRDSVNVDTGVMSGHYLSLDQGLVMAAIGNALDRDVLRVAFADRDLERSLRPVVGIEEFGASPRGCTMAGTPGADRLRGTSHRDVICAGEVTTAWTHAAARTPCSGTEVTTAWTAAPATTRSTAATAGTASTAARVGTCCPRAHGVNIRPGNPTAPAQVVAAHR